MRMVSRRLIFAKPYFSCGSLLLSSTVLNDKIMHTLIVLIIIIIVYNMCHIIIRTFQNCHCIN